MKLHSKLNKASTIVQWFVRYAKVFSGRELGTLPLDPTTQKTLKPPMSVVLQLMEDARQNKILGEFSIHVGGSRCVTSSTGNNMKIHARITLTVEFIRTGICIFLFYV